LDLTAFTIFYFETMAPFFIFATLTLIWFYRFDRPRLESREWLRAGPIPLTHHIFEFIAFLVFGWAIKTVGFPLYTLPLFMGVIAIITYPMVRQFEARRKTRDSRLLIVATFLVMEAAIVLGYLI